MAAFFEKLNYIAKSVNDAANNAAETTRIKNRISFERIAVKEACCKIGEYYYAKHVDNPEPVGDEEILGYLTEIDEHMKVIAELEAALEAERAAKETIRSMASAATAVERPAAFEAERAAKETDQPSDLQCQSCGTKNEQGAKFCRECGGKLN